MRSEKLGFLSVLAMIGIVAILFGPIVGAGAADRNWDPTAEGDNWWTDTKWVEGSAPTAGQSVSVIEAGLILNIADIS